MIDAARPSDESVALTAFVPDQPNARKHNGRNLALIERSLREVGAARSIAVDGAGIVSSGNATVAAAERVGIGREPTIVEADRTEPVAVRRAELPGGTAGQAGRSAPRTQPERG